MSESPTASAPEHPSGGRVIIVGSINDDTILTVHRLPRPGETIHSTHRSSRFGGKGANQAVASARFEGRTTLIGCAGTDRSGDDAIRNLEDNGVDTHPIARSASPTGAAVVLVDDNGENEIIVSSGANANLDAATVQRALDDISLQHGDIVGVGFEVSDDAVRATIEAVTGAGAHPVLNPSPVRPLPAAIVGCRSTVILNESEAALLATADSARDAAIGLSTDFASSVVLTLGSAGALLVSDGDTVQIPALKVEPLDTVGAGDTLFGTHCAGLAAGRPPGEAARLAVAAAAIAVTSTGAQDGMPTLRHVESVLAT